MYNITLTYETHLMQRSGMRSLTESEGQIGQSSRQKRPRDRDDREDRWYGRGHRDDDRAARAYAILALPAPLQRQTQDQRGKNWRSQGQGQWSGSQRAGPGWRIICWICKQEGHVRKDCSQRSTTPAVVTPVQT
ncbi:hypothetical protein Scep_001935 [Stephania cephalantha]|uniref:CCHC-type domain-containing protein n=1 Tax=Stephania cephalantha TaxID=152367 RepID=A0AAP0LCV6_9MAGN